MHDGNDGHLVRVIATGDTEPEAVEAAVAVWNRRYERTCNPVLTEYNEVWTGWKCSECGHPIDEANWYCAGCGARVVDDE